MDADRYRAAIRDFMRRHDLKPYPWATRAKVPESTLRDFLAGRSADIGLDKLDRLARAAGATVAEVLGERAMRKAADDEAPAPYVKRLKLREDGCGVRVSPESDGEPLPWPREWIALHLDGDAENGRMVTCRGESAVRDIRQHDTVCIDLRRTDPLREPGVYCLWDGAALLLRRVTPLPQGGRARMRLLSENENYPELDYDAASLQAVGRVVWRGGAI